MANRPGEDRASLWFVRLAFATCAALLVAAGVWLVLDPPRTTADSGGGASGSVAIGAGSGGIDLGQRAADSATTPTAVLERAGVAMGATDSVEFWLERSGAPVFIDQFGSIALDTVHGQFVVPADAHATIEVTIDGDLRSRLGAIAYGDEVWLSNPVTGEFETLPEGYDIDPSRFFDPAGGWRPLIEHLTDATIAERGDTWYRIRGTAPAADVANVTVGLIRDQDVAIELVVDAGTALVTEAHFTTGVDGAESTWDLTLDHYGATFDIQPPPTTAPASERTDGGG